MVWAHNFHIGDASATEMGAVRDEINIGQLCRGRFGTDAVLIGFGTDYGTMAAADDWDGPMEIEQVRPSHPDSYERLCHNSGASPLPLDLRQGGHEGLRRALLTSRLERFSRSCYRPQAVPRDLAIGTDCLHDLVERL